MTIKFENLILVTALIITVSSAIQYDYVSEIVTSFGYPIEIHKSIKTKDGYLLTLHRIPHGKVGNISGVKRKPILLIPGFTGSSENFLFLGPSKSIGFLLADFGYDVWLGSVRSVSYSRYHVNLNPDKDVRFWDFSLTEMGIYDLPAKIDYILKLTGFQQLQYFGFSQGVQLMLIMCSELPNYAKKVEFMIALGPAVYVYNSPHPWLGLLLPFADLISTTLSTLRIHEILPRPIKEVLTQTCHLPGIDQLCIKGLQAFVGTNFEQFNKSYVPLMARNVFEGVSLKQVEHLSQIMRLGKFQHYDYGNYKNYLKYGKENPPGFNASRMSFPIAVYSAKSDWFVTPDNVQKLVKELPNVVDNYLVEYYKFCHFDFLGANDIRPLLYDRILKIMNNYIN